MASLLETRQKGDAGGGISDEETNEVMANRDRLEAQPPTRSINQEYEENLQNTAHKADEDDGAHFSSRHAAQVRTRGFEHTDMSEWSRLRYDIFKLVQSQSFEMLMGVVICFNLMVIIVEVDNGAQCYTVYEHEDECPTRAGQIIWIYVLNLIMLIVYTIEAVLRFYAERLHFFKNYWNDLDLFVVIVGWTLELIDSNRNISMLRFFRTLRLLRIMRIFISFRELYLLVSGLFSALKTLLFSALMLMALLTLCSIVLVEHAHPVNVQIEYGDQCWWCQYNYASVWESNLTLFQQIVTGDSWGTSSVPVIRKAPWLAPVMVGIVVMISLGFMNLILAVIVERAQDAREKDREERVRRKMLEKEEQKLELLGYCKRMDTDGSGNLDIKELIDAYDSLPAFNDICALMDIHKDELKSVFKLLDRDCSGTVSYEEFCEELHKIRTRDTRTMLTFVQLSIAELAAEIHELQKGVGVESREQKLRRMASRRSNRSPADASSAEPARVRSGFSLPPADLDRRPAPRPQQAQRDSAAAWMVLPEPTHIEQVRGPRDQMPPGADGGKALSLGREARQLASLKSGTVQRLEEQLQTLVSHSDWLSDLSTWAASPEACLPSAGKLDFIEDKLGRLQSNLHDAERRFEDSAAALARNTELLCALSKDMGYHARGQTGCDGIRSSPSPPPRAGAAAAQADEVRNISLAIVANVDPPAAGRRLADRGDLCAGSRQAKTASKGNLTSCRDTPQVGIAPSPS